MLCNAASQVGDDCSAKPFDLAIALGEIGSSHRVFDSQMCSHGSEEIRDDLQSFIYQYVCKYIVQNDPNGGKYD